MLRVSRLEDASAQSGLVVRSHRHHNGRSFSKRRLKYPVSPRAAAKIQSLSQDPRPAGSEKLSGQDKYRLRQGDYRILYAIDDPSATVVIVKIGHRRNVYR